jgi:TctA family transporter
MLGFVLAPMIEENFRRALLVSGGDLTIFVERPISLGFLLASAVLLAAMAFSGLRRRRQEVFSE